MDVRDGRLYPEFEVQRDALLKKLCIPVEGEKLTPKQLETRQVSIHDHRTPAGIQLTTARQVGRNEPCPCGSGKKFKFCCLNV